MLYARRRRGNKIRLYIRNVVILPNWGGRPKKIKKLTGYSSLLPPKWRHLLVKLLLWYIIFTIRALSQLVIYRWPLWISLSFFNKQHYFWMCDHTDLSLRGQRESKGVYFLPHFYTFTVAVLWPSWREGEWEQPHILSHDTYFLLTAPKKSLWIISHSVRHSHFFALGIVFPTYQDKIWHAQGWQATHCHSLDFLSCERERMIREPSSHNSLRGISPISAGICHCLWQNKRALSFTVKKTHVQKAPVCHQGFSWADSSNSSQDVCLVCCKFWQSHIFP